MKRILFLHFLLVLLLHSSPVNAESNRERCGLTELPLNYDVFAVGVKNAERDLRWHRPGKSKKAGGVVDVVVTATDKPVVLVLTAYEPVLWKVGRVPTAIIAGVLVSGNFNQEVVGIPDNIPVKYISQESPKNCPYFHNHNMGAGIETMNKRVYDLVGRGIDRFYTAEIPEGPFYVGLRGPVGSDNVIYDNRAEWIPIVNDEYNDEKYLNDLIERGIVSRADSKEIEQWEVKASRRANVTRSSFMTPGETLLIRRKVIFPEDRKERYSFLVKPGVSAPAGIKADEHIFFLKDYTCQIGAGARVLDETCFR